MTIEAGIHYGLRLQDPATESFNPSDRCGMVNTSKGRREVYVHETQIRIYEGDSYIAVSQPLASGTDGQVLVELTREAADGAKRVWVDCRDIVKVLELEYSKVHSPRITKINK